MKVTMWSRAPGGGQLELEKVGACVRVTLTAGGGDTSLLNLTPDQAREMADALERLADMKATEVPASDPHANAPETRRRT